MASKKNSAMNDRQLWNVWADCLGLIVENSDEDDEDAEKKESNTMKLGKDGDEDDEDAEKKKKESNTMKLRKDDMSLFGFCPAWDDFYLVVCEHCGSVVKPQSLQSHIELRHGNTPLAKSERTESVTQLSKSPVSKGSSVSHSTSNKTTSPSARSSSLRHNSKTSSHDHSSRASTDATVQLFLQWEPCDSQTSQVASSHSSSNSSKPEKKKPQPKMKKNNAMAPVVRVERITPNLVKSTNSPSNTVSADKKELPSPQQPPPVALVTSSSTILSPSGQNSLVSGPSCTPLNTNSSSSAATGVSSTMHSMEKSEGPHLAQKKPSSENKKAPKERKLVPCKDREYDPNKHCGVVIPDTGKPCTRSLTCKTHSLSLRRAVVDRVRVFDDLLSEHRATKEATVKAAKSKSAVGKGSPIAAQNADQITTATQPTIPEHTSSTTTTTVTSTKVELGPSKVNANTSTNGLFKIPSVTPVTAQESKKSSVLQGISPNRIPSVSHGSDVCSAEPMVIEVEKRLVEPEAVFTRGSTPDPPYINHHPRPSSICTFGIRRLGNGMLLMDRRFDKVRAAFKSALSTERSSHPLPVKRLCVESRLPPVPEPLDPSDPYSFTCSESQSEPVPQITQSGPSIVINKVVMVAPTDAIQQTTPCVTTSSKTKTISVPTTSVTLSHNCSQPKTSASKTKDKSSSSSKPSNNDNRVYNSPPSKKKRKSSTIPNGSSVSKQSVLPTLSSTTSNVTLSPMTPHLSSIPSHLSSIPSHLSMGNQLGALSRLQVMGLNNHPLSAIINNPGLTAFGGAPQHVMSKDSSVMVTGLDPLNGQMPVSSALLHSVTVSGPLLASSAGGLGITIGAGGLVSQFPQLPNRPIGENMNSSTSSNKNSHTISSILNNSHVLTSDHNTWSRTKAKSKTRKNSKASVNSMSHSQNACDSSLDSGYTTILSHSLSSPSMTSPHLCSGSTSPQVPISSPLHNGLGTSPPPFFNPKTISISGTMSSNQPLSVSPASRASTPSPETDMSSPGSTGSGQKGKNFNRPIPVCLPQESEISTSPSAFQVTLPLTVTSVDMGDSVQTTLCKMEDGQTISLQQLLSSHAILDAQLCQQMPLSGRVQHENNSPTKSSTNSNLTTAILPLKLPLLMTSGTTVAHQLLQLPMDISKKNGVSKPGPPFPHH